jgi:hypothetical protein
LPSSSPPHDTDSARVISRLEVCASIFVVVAHNVFHGIPNEVPILFVLAIASFRPREGGAPFFGHHQFA